jgi:hypothetical protein
MARLRLFPRYRRPSLGELLGISRAERQVSRKYHLRIVRDPMAPLKSAERRAKPRAGYYSPLMGSPTLAWGQEAPTKVWSGPPSVFRSYKARPS